MRTSFLPLLSDWMGGVFTFDDFTTEATYATPEDFSITMPGYETVEAKLSPRSRSLTVIGKDEEGKEATKRSYYFSQRDFDLLDQEAVEAEYRRGILTVKLPKKAEEKKRMEEKQIKVKLLE